MRPLSVRVSSRIRDAVDTVFELTSSCLDAVLCLCALASFWRGLVAHVHEHIKSAPCDASGPCRFLRSCTTPHHLQLAHRRSSGSSLGTALCGLGGSALTGQEMQHSVAIVFDTSWQRAFCRGDVSGAECSQLWVHTRFVATCPVPCAVLCARSCGCIPVAA